MSKLSGGSWTRVPRWELEPIRAKSQKLASHTGVLRGARLRYKHKPTPVGRPIVSRCDGPTEKLSSFVDKLLKPIKQQQKSYLKDTTDFINYIQNTKVPADVIVVSNDVTSLYTNIPEEKGIHTACRAYETFHRNEPPTPT